jgi:predicted P-loop ATPase/GTPase
LNLIVFTLFYFVKKINDKYVPQNMQKIQNNKRMAVEIKDVKREGMNRVLFC